MYEQKGKNITKLQLAITLTLVLFFSATGLTYAYLLITDATDNRISGNMATVTFDMSVEKIFPATTQNNTNVMVPQLQTTNALTNALKGGCVDQNRNVACQVYKITIKNRNSTINQLLDGKISFYSNPEMTKNISNTMPNLKWRLITSADKTTPSNSTLGTGENYIATATDIKFVSNLQIEKNTQTEHSYYIMVWINETNKDQQDKSTPEQEKTFYGKITVDSANGTGITAYFES